MKNYNLGDIVKIKQSINIFTQACFDVKNYHFHTECYEKIKKDEFENKIGTILEYYHLENTYNFGNTIWLYKKFKYKDWYLVLIENKKFWISDSIIESI